jgi:hypothetical protein
MTVRIVDAPPPPPKVVTPLWTVTKGNQRIDAELVGQGSTGWELRMQHNFEWLSGRQFRGRADAVAHGDQHRQHLLARGWVRVLIAIFIYNGTHPM